MQLPFWALSIAGFIVLFSSATPVERPNPEQFSSSTTTNVTSFLSVTRSLIPTSLSATPQNTSPSPTTTTFSRQTTTTTQPGIPLPPSTITAQVPTSRPGGEHGCKSFFFLTCPAQLQPKHSYLPPPLAPLGSQ